MENTVIKVLTIEHGKKVIEWWDKQGIDTRDLIGIGCESDGDTYIYYGVIEGIFDNWGINKVQYYNAKIIELPAEEEFDMSTDEGRLAYAKKHYPAGTRYISPEYPEKVYTVSNAIDGPHYWLGVNTYKNCVLASLDKHTGQFIYFLGKWAEIVKEEEKMETQKLSRAGLKEIHSVACATWKLVLEKYGTRNPFEDYIELTQDEVNAMFSACTKDQLPYVHKHLKQDDGSVDISKVIYNENGALLNDKYLVRHNAFTSITNGFWLNPDYNWEVKMISDTPFLVPTKKK